MWSSSVTLARPVRTPASSLRKSSTAFSMRDARLRHRFLAVGNCAHRFELPFYSAVTVEPTFSPITARRMFPGMFILKMMIGIRLSMHSEMAVESMTARPF